MSTVWRPNARMSNVSKDCGKKNSSVLIAKHFKETLNGFFWKSESDNFLREEYSIDVLGLQKIRSTMFNAMEKEVTVVNHGNKQDLYLSLFYLISLA